MKQFCSRPYQAEKMASLGISYLLENVEMSLVGELAIPQTASLFAILSNIKELFLSLLCIHKEQFLCSMFNGISCPMNFSEAIRLYCIVLRTATLEMNLLETHMLKEVLVQKKKKKIIL